MSAIVTGSPLPDAPAVRAEVSKSEPQFCTCGCGREATYGHGGLSRACYLRRWYAAHPGYMREYRRRLHAKWGDKIKVYQRLKQRECRARLRAQEGPKTTSDLGPKAGPGCARGL